MLQRTRLGEKDYDNNKIEHELLFRKIIRWGGRNGSLRTLLTILDKLRTATSPGSSIDISVHTGSVYYAAIVGGVGYLERLAAI